MKAEAIQKWDEIARRNFSYQADGKIDRWESKAPLVLANVPYSGDCDDLASTVLDLCTRAGLSLEDGYRLVVFASSDGSGHMCGAAKDDEGRFWAVGDTFAPAYRVEHFLHKPNIYNRLSEFEIDPVTKKVKAKWRLGLPWRLETEA